MTFKTYNPSSNFESTLVTHDSENMYRLKMDNMINRPSPDYGFDVTHVNGYIDSRGLNYNCTSTNSSPSPVIVCHYQILE